MNINITDSVAAFLDRHNLGQAEFAKSYAIAIRGWRQLNWDISGTTKRVVINIDSDMTATLPDDCISILNLGVDNGHGGIASFSRTLNINPYSDNSLNQEGSNQFDGWDTDVEYGIPNQTSLGSGSYETIGEYSLSPNSRVILIQPNSGFNQIVVEYLSHTGNEDCDYSINELATEAMISWIDWQFHLGDKRIGIAEKRDKERMFYNEKSKAKRRIKQLTVSDLNRAARTSVKMGIKS